MLDSRIKSFTFAFKGIRDLFSTQVNARIHLFVALMVAIAGFWLEITLTEWALVILAIFSVIAAEAFNTAIELLTDLVSPDYHKLAGRTKDVAAAAVLFTSIGAIGVGLMVFGPRLLALFN
ncbi:MAG: diacylglycerol kinase family protein [Bacteroidetes bacterium]|nr:diacylglycerol kinase family protein [Bacteroidota bacterium]